MSPTDDCYTYLVTGANRGVKSFIRSRVTVIAGVRDPASPSSKALANVPKDPSSTLIVVKIDNSSATDAKAAVDYLRSQHNITRLDTVVANAAVQNLVFAKLADVDPAQVHEHTSINAVGSLVLF
ncbi:hypothetical protein MMC28_005152 [Mycoblastus sanguinarius]|nr:hypothetical protein [Mycoblastus sanguinarius]